MGSLRYNLDPQGQREDKDLWEALEQSHLKQYVLGLDNELDCDINDSGECLR